MPSPANKVTHLLLQHPEYLSNALEMAAAYHVRESLEAWLRDGRVRSKVEQELRKRGAQGRATFKKLARVWPPARSRGR